MHHILKKLYQSQFLTEIESYELFRSIIKGRMNDIQLSSLLIAIKMRGLSENEIIGAIQAYSEKFKFFPAPGYNFSDCTGTGGDTINSINLSTASALVAATCGYKIVKHCNHKISSQTGSSDVLTELGINLNISSEKSRYMLDTFNICFLSAPIYNDGFKNIEKVRTILKTKTLFNILGPLLNPAKPIFSIIGVYDKKLITIIINILNKLNYKRAIVLYSSDCDEVTLSGKTYISELKNNKIISYTVEAKDFGFHYHSNVTLKGGNPKENSDILKKIFKGYGSLAQEETIAANVALLLKIFGNENIKDNAQYALKIIRSGETYHTLKKLIEKR
ncbi:anthranilate phosphoribosyltransferase [Buchnera aphidicola (Formosaphis micheliae)]|uniref:anthranilate phosphoribosyltransferase n=1 Tax=Buchnera aphidicola TaxID=9 RepID=UPI0031CC5334